MATVTKNSYEMGDNDYLDADCVHIWSKDLTLQEFVTLITNSSHLGDVEIETVAEWADS